jgi:hypothetical protein
LIRRWLIHVHDQKLASNKTVTIPAYLEGVRHSSVLWTQRRNLEVEMTMKIYLLMLLIAVLLTAVHFTAPAHGQRKAPQQ